jgi:opacity protein-like surface antigen
MKEIMIIAVLFILSTTTGISQTRWGIKAGANVASIKLNNEFEEKFDTKAENRVGYQLGLIAERELSESMFLKAEIYYALKGYKFYLKDLDTEAKRAFSYFMLPVFVGYSATPDLSFFLGPQIGLLGPVHNRQKGGERQSLRQIVEFNNIDLGAGAGVAYKITSSIGMDIRYTYGFSTLSEYEFRDSSMNYLSAFKEKNNRTLEISLNYFFKPKE